MWGIYEQWPSRFQDRNLTAYQVVELRHPGSITYYESRLRAELVATASTYEEAVEVARGLRSAKEAASSRALT